ncbi:MAG: hypothetical protein WD738_20340 [Pirellulales bacterium]
MSHPIVVSRNGVPIRLTDERWQHKMEEHAELAGLRQEVLKAITNGERVLSGSAGELMAVRMIEPGKALVVVYREMNADDEFVITAFLTRRLRSLERRAQIWPTQA